MPYYEVLRDGLTVGTVVYRAGDIIDMSSVRSTTRAGRVFKEQVERDGGHRLLRPVDGRTSQVKGAEVRELPQESLRPRPFSIGSEPSTVEDSESVIVTEPATEEEVDVEATEEGSDEE